MELKVIEDLSYVVLLRKKFSYIESIPGVLLPHPSSSAYPYKLEPYGNIPPEQWHNYQGISYAPQQQSDQLYDHFNNMPMKVTPSMSSLEALLSKLPSVVPPQQSSQQQEEQRALEFMGGMQKVAKEELDEEQEEVYRPEQVDVGESSTSSMSRYQHHHHFHQDHHHHHLGNGSNNNNNGF
jgi:hypothetical protein